MPLYKDPKTGKWTPEDADWDLPEYTYPAPAAVPTVMAAQKSALGEFKPQASPFSQLRLDILKRRLAALNRWTPGAQQWQ